MIPRRAAAGAVLLVIGVVGLVACGGGESVNRAERPLTFDDAQRLALVQFENFESQGAEFRASSAFVVGPTPETVSLVGIVDWVAHRGYAFVSGNGSVDGLTEVVWDEQYIFERRPGWDPIIAGRGGPTGAYVVRAPDPERLQLDRLIATVMGLAAEQPDNALLIQQTAGSAFVRDDELNGVPVQVLRYGTRNLYWLRTDTSDLLRFDGNSTGANAPTIVDIVRRGAQTVELPPGELVIDGGTVPQLLASVYGR